MITARCASDRRTGTKLVLLREAHKRYALANKHENSTYQDCNCRTHDTISTASHNTNTRTTTRTSINRFGSDHKTPFDPPQCVTLSESEGLSLKVTSVTKRPPRNLKPRWWTNQRRSRASSEYGVERLANVGGPKRNLQQRPESASRECRRTREFDSRPSEPASRPCYLG